MAGTFNTTFVTKIMSKLSELNHIKNIYAKCHLTDKLLNYDLLLGREILHKLGVIFNFKNKTIIWQEVSISLKQPIVRQKNSLLSKKVAQLEL